MAWITGNGSSVGPGIMRTGRVWHWAQLIVNTWLLCSGGREIGSHRGWSDKDASRLRTPDLDAVREVGSAFWFSARARSVRYARAGFARPVQTLSVTSALLSGSRPAPVRFDCRGPAPHARSRRYSPRGAVSSCV